MSALFALADLTAPAAGLAAGAAPELAGAALTGAVSPLDGPASLVWALVIPVLLAALALLLKRKPAATRRLQIVETAGLGGKRELILAQLGGETLLLASSEAGVTLLAARTLPPEAPAAVPAPAPAAAPAPAPAPSPLSLVRGLFSRQAVAPRPAAQQPQSFQSLLEESAEDLDLRRKLAAGRRGQVAGSAW